MRWSQLPLALSVLGMLCFGTAAANPASGWLLVANKDDNRIGIIDPVSGRQVAEVAEGGVTGHEIVASPDGKLAYVPIYGDSGVGQPGTDGTNLVVIDLALRKVVGNVDFGKGVRPHCPKLGPRNGLLYVSTELDRSISIVDPATFAPAGDVRPPALAIVRAVRNSRWRRRKSSRSASTSRRCRRRL